VLVELLRLLRPFWPILLASTSFGIVGGTAVTALLATINDSLKLAKAVLGEIGGVNDLHKAHVEQAGFAVLKAPDIPSILIETAFISNPEEEKRLNDNAYQDKMADAIISGIRKYFAKNPPLAKSKLARLD